MALIDKVRAITKSTSTETSDAQLVYFAQAGANYVIMSIPKSMLWWLAEDGSNITDGNGQAASADVILEVRRNGIPCEIVSSDMSYQLSYSGSLFEATAFFPKYYARTGKVYIKPDPTALAVGVITKVIPPTIAVATDWNTGIYRQIENLVILYAAAMDFMALANYFSREATDTIGSATGDYYDAMEKAELLIDGTVTDKNAQEWIDDEDSEMVQAVIQTAYQEVQRALAALSSNKDYSSEAQAYLLKSKQYFEMAQVELGNYIRSNPQMMMRQMAREEREEQ